MNKKNKLQKNIYLAIIVTLVIILISIFSSSYTLDGFKIVKASKLEIYSPVSDITIFIDEKEEKIKTEKTIKLDPGSYSILASKDNYWPWAKKVEIIFGKTTKISPFLFPKEPTQEVVTKDNSNYEEIIAFFSESEREISVVGKTVTLQLENNQVTADWSTRKNSSEKLIVFSPIEQIKNIAFYPEREDVFIVSVNSGVYALEINTEGSQNFQPIYSGVDPSFYLKENLLYIKDGENLLKINL